MDLHVGDPSLEQALARQRLLGDVLRWLDAVGGELVDVVVQDEYTHDVIVRLGDGRVLVYDTT